MWRGDSRSGLSVSAPFVWRGPNTLAVVPFPQMPTIARVGRAGVSIEGIDGRRVCGPRLREVGSQPSLQCDAQLGAEAVVRPFRLDRLPVLPLWPLIGLCCPRSSRQFEADRETWDKSLALLLSPALLLQFWLERSGA